MYTPKSWYSLQRKIFCIGLCASVMAGATLTLAQSSGTLSGTIKDPSGAGIPNVELTLTNTETGVKRLLVSDDTGFYTAIAVPIGAYTLGARAPGFQSVISEPFRIDLRVNAVVNLELTVGQVTESVQVQAHVQPLEEVGTGELGTLVVEEQITELPLKGRSFVPLTLLVPGASVGQEANIHPTGFLADVDISFSGSRSNANMWLIDGVNNMDLGSGRKILVYPSVESIAELKVLRNSFSADMPSSGGAQINLVTKSGTKDFHGTAYEFHRNSAFNATEFFLNRAGQPRQPLTLHNFGYSLGGPLVREKLFFFWSQEWRREGRGTARQALVPTELERAGDFSGPNSRDYPDPIDWLTGEPFPGNRIPPDRLSRAGLAWTRLYPLPNLPLETSPVPGYNWVTAPKSPINTRQENLRIDAPITSRDSAMARFTRDTWKNGSPTFVEGGLWGDDLFPAVDSSWDRPGQSVSSQWTRAFGPSAINQVTFSWSGNRTWRTHGAGKEINSELVDAIPEVFLGPQDEGHAIFWGDPLGNELWHQAPWHNDEDLYAWKDDFVAVMGTHSMKTGFLYSRNRKDEVITNDSQPAFWTDGGKAIAGSAAGGWAPVAAAPGRNGDVTGNGVADILLKGTYWGSGTEKSADPAARIRWRDYEAHLADTWRLTPRLTVTAGVRWAYLPNPWDAEGRVGNFVLALYDPKQEATPDNGLIYSRKLKGADSRYAALGINPDSLVRNHLLDFAPRVGIAWDPTGKGSWAIRAGAGVFYNRESVEDLFLMGLNPPFVRIVDWGCCRPLDSLPPDGDESNTQYANLERPRAGAEINAKTPGSYQWNLTVERDLGRNTKLEVGYVANRGHHIPGIQDLNQVPDDLRATYALWKFDEDDSTNPESLRPLYQDSGTGPTIVTRNLDSWYHSLQAYLARRYSSRFSYQVSYSFGKLLSTAHNVGRPAGNPNRLSNPYDSRYDKGLAAYDRTHILTANSMYKTPALLTLNPFPRMLFGDWETAVIFTLTSGRPETVWCCDQLLGLEQSRPDLVGNPEGPRTADQWFNTNAFSPPRVLGHLGNSPIGQYRGPGIENWDLSFMKNLSGLKLQKHEGELQLRVELYNAFNHTQFMLVDNVFNVVTTPSYDSDGKLTNWSQINQNFGRVTRIREPREIQIALKLIF